MKNFVVDGHRIYHRKYFLTVIFASVFLFSFGILVQNVFADQVVATIPIRGYDIGVNPNTNTIYVASPGGYNCQGCAISVIDGATSSVTNTIMDQSGPIDVGVNPNTNKIYVANFG